MRALLLALLLFNATVQAHSQAAELLPGETPIDMIYRLLDATLPTFMDQAFDTDGTGHPNAQLLFAVRSPPNSPNAEFLWVNQISRDADGQFRGLLITGSATNPNLPAGTPITVSEVALADWGFVAPDGRHWGYISARAQAIAQDNPEFLATLMPDILPPDWK
ncbi:DUF2314 domain-containing protein [Gymnodinialimonas hymeniacidonis]|uniref:DUF2314 domain-containing protein n=1 Tax=Gymnodinialimonas hymeniacidonis TaxID=3126508 RepID=UPI0034C66AB5